MERMIRKKEDDEGGEETPPLAAIGRVSASALLPAGARLLVPRSALEKKKKCSSSEGRQDGAETEESGGGGVSEQELEEDPATLALARRLRRRLLFSGPGFCVLDKPSGVHVQGGSRREARGATLDAAAAAAARRGWLFGTATAATQSEMNPTSDSSSSSSFLGARLVHRLDAPGEFLPLDEFFLLDRRESHWCRGHLTTVRTRRWFAAGGEEQDEWEQSLEFHEARWFEDRS